jgi:hypothetical protein
MFAFDQGHVSDRPPADRSHQLFAEVVEILSGFGKKFDNQRKMNEDRQI